MLGHYSTGHGGEHWGQVADQHGGVSAVLGDGGEGDHTACHCQHLGNSDNKKISYELEHVTPVEAKSSAKLSYNPRITSQSNKNFEPSRNTPGNTWRTVCYLNNEDKRELCLSQTKDRL